MESKQVTGKAGQIGFFAFLFVFVILLCNNPLWREPDGATQTLTTAGYQNIEILPYQFMRHCGRIGPFVTHFRATTFKGETVSGKVCRSFFSDPYIKLDKKAKTA